MSDPAVLFLLVFAACGMVLAFVRTYYSWPRGFFAGEGVRKGQPGTLEKVLRTGISLWLVWVVVHALVTSRLSIMVPGRIDPNYPHRAARIVLHGSPLIMMCLACFCAAAALMLELAWWRHLCVARSPHRRAIRGLSFLAVACFGLSLFLWLSGNIIKP